MCYFWSGMKSKIIFIFPLLLTSCGILPSKTGGDINGAVDTANYVTHNTPPYIIYSLGGYAMFITMVLIAVIFLFVKSPFQR